MESTWQNQTLDDQTMSPEPNLSVISIYIHSDSKMWKEPSGHQLCHVTEYSSLHNTNRSCLTQHVDRYERDQSHFSVRRSQWNWKNTKRLLIKNDRGCAGNLKSLTLPQQEQRTLPELLLLGTYLPFKVDYTNKNHSERKKTDYLTRLEQHNKLWLINNI